jgi:hypothetical protein
VSWWAGVTLVARIGNTQQNRREDSVLAKPSINRTRRIQRVPWWPFIRIFTLGALATAAIVWGIVHHYTRVREPFYVPDTVDASAPVEDWGWALEAGAYPIELDP